MSQWTHVRGTIELKADCFETKNFNLKMPRMQDYDYKNDYESFRKDLCDYHNELNKKRYLPFPKDQFKLVGCPEISYKEPKHLTFEANLYSLPRAIKYIEKACEFLPHNELGYIRHSVDQNDIGSSLSCGTFTASCLKKAYKEALEDFFSDPKCYSSTSFNSLMKYFDTSEHIFYTFKNIQKYKHVEDTCHISYVDCILLAIRDDLRHCDAREFKEGFKKFLKYLYENRISVDDGYVEWEDEWDGSHIYAWRYKGSNHYMSFLTLDRVTGEIVEEERYYRKKDIDGDYYLSEDDYEFDIVTLTREDLLKERK